MKYDNVDVEAVEAEVIGNLYKQSSFEVANLDLDSARVDFCQGVLVAAGKDIDQELVKHQETLASSKSDKEAERVVYASKIQVSDLSSERAEWLRSYITQVEREHAAHGVLIALATERGEELEGSVIAQIVCEGAHGAAKAELSGLVGEPVVVDPKVVDPKVVNEEVGPF